MPRSNRPTHRAPTRHGGLLARYRSRLAPVLALVIALTGLTVSGGSPAQAASAGWIVRCDFSHALPDDPIVYPQQRGASHVHDFVGNTSTNGMSTYKSMVSATAKCGLPKDTAGYWTPALYRNGVKVAPAGSYGGRSARPKIYYRDDNLNAGTRVEPFPPDMRLIAGNHKATTAAQSPKLGSAIYWGCSDNSTGKLTTPPASCSTGIMSLHVGFPSCWNGVRTGVNDTANVVYPSGGKCPAGFPRALPRMILRWEYPVTTTTGKITLASGSPYSIHADFWNTWDQARLSQLVDDCLNADQSCGTPTS